MAFVGNATESNGCARYALRYAADYTAVGRWRLQVAVTTTVAAVSAEDCAERCSEFSDGNCFSFAHCSATADGKGPVCFLYGVRATDAESIDRTGDCTLYARRFRAC